jgi:phosphatidylglycerol lysyltransferase
VKHLASALLTLGLFGAALWALRYELRGHTLREILDRFESIPPHLMLGAAGLTVLSYLTLTGYEILGLMMIKAKLRYRTAALASFISYAFSNNVGLTLITGGSIRYRIYAARGISAVDIAYITAFCTFSFGLGAVFIISLAALLEPAVIGRALHVPDTVALWGAILAMVGLSGYLAAGAFLTGTIKFRQWEFRLPKVQYTVAQIILAICDLTLAAGVLYTLLPAGTRPPFDLYLAVYVVAILVGAVSHVPGGIGVFESLMIFMLPEVHKAPLLGSILAYRCVYFILPLAFAALLALGQEIVTRRPSGINDGFSHSVKDAKGRGFAASLTGWLPKLSPQIVGTLVTIAGAVLLFSGSYPSIDNRLDFLQQLLPLSVLEISHLLNAVTGLALLILSRGLFRRLDAAYHLTVIGLCAGIFFSLLKGIDYEEAILLAIVLAILIPSRPAYYRKAKLVDQRFTPQWLVTIGIVVVAAAWLGFFSYKHVEYTNSLWWDFAFTDKAPRFLRATLVVVTLVLIFALWNLLRPAPPLPGKPTAEDLERARAIIAKSPVGAANLALLGDKSLLFSDSERSFIMYGVIGRTWVALGDPVGPEDEQADLAWKFRELCDLYDGRPVFYHVDKKNLSLYADLGLQLLKLGEEARVSLADADASLDRPDRKDLRYARKRAEREGATFEVLAPGQFEALLPELKAISDSWLASKHTREKGFSVGFFDPAYLRNFHLAIVRQNGVAAAFASLWVSANHEEVMVDLMRHSEAAPYGVMDYLFAELMLWGAANGYHWLNLGMAPLSGFEDNQLASIWHKLGTFLFEHGENFYNFEGLRRYKAKFSPEWQPKYLASTGGFALPKILFDVSTLVAGGLRGVVGKGGVRK